jgi:ankyrin repeat protein
MAGNLDVVRLLLQNGASINFPFGGADAHPLTVASRHGHKDIVDLFLTTGVNLEDVILLQQLRDKSARMTMTQEVTCGMASLHLAANGGYTGIVQALIDAGIDVNADWGNSTPLMGAARGGHLDTVTKLIALGADVNRQDDLGRTALMLSALEGHGPVVSLLVKSGARLGLADDRGNTVTFYARQYPRIIADLRAAEVGGDAPRSTRVDQ